MLSLLARVLWNKPDIPASQHVVLVVTIEGVAYLVDAAFGGLGSIGESGGGGRAATTATSKLPLLFVISQCQSVIFCDLLDQFILCVSFVFSLILNS